ncbi:hypothetical protein HFP67_31875 [Bacillus sp. CB102A.1]
MYVNASQETAIYKVLAIGAFLQKRSLANLDQIVIYTNYVNLRGMGEGITKFNNSLKVQIIFIEFNIHTT